MGELDLRRVAIVGPSNAGKSTLAWRLSGLLGLPVVDLDDLNFLPDWQEREHDDFRGIVDRVTKGERWVTAGNYGRVRDLVWGRATALVWLDPPFVPTLFRAVHRTLRRAVLGERCCNGNRERLLRTFFTRESILWWVVTTHARRRDALETALASEGWRDLPHVRLRTQAEVALFVEGCGS